MKILSCLLATSLPILIQGECSFCFNGEEVANLGAAVAKMATARGSCLDLKAEYERNKDDLGKNGAEKRCIEFQLEGYQKGCCNMVNPDGCGLCPDGSPAGEGYVVPTMGTDDPSPEECEGYAFQPFSSNGIFIAGSCADTLGQRSAFYCGCPGQYQQTWLCPDKQKPNRRRRGDFTRDENCGQTEYLFSLFKEFEITETNTDFGFHYQAWCECNDVVLENEYNCPFCSAGQNIKEGYHDKIVNEDTAAVDINGKYDYRRTCTQVADFTRYVTADFKCSDENVELARRFCCPAPGLGVTMGLLVTGIVMIQNLFF